MQSWYWQACGNNPVHAAHRPRSLDAYSLERNGSLGRELLATELSSVSIPVSGAGGRSLSGLGSERVSGSAMAARPPEQASQREQGRESQGRRRHVLLGHSMGAACAAAEAIENPEVRVGSRGLGVACMRCVTAHGHQQLSRYTALHIFTPPAILPAHVAAYTSPGMLAAAVL